MRKYRLFISITMCCVCMLCGSGCSSKEAFVDDGSNSFVITNGAPRLVISGSVTNPDGHAIQGIHVAVYGVREEQETDALTYNYAITDSAGKYTIIRYRGRELPAEVTVVAKDLVGVYEEQWVFSTIQYDSVYTKYNTKEPFNGFATADFILEERKN